MNRQIYKIGYNRLGVLLLPVKMRQKGILALLGALMRPLSILHRNFTLFADSVITPVNSQVCRLEAMLNDKYDYYGRQIRVVDVPFEENAFFLHDNIPQFVADNDPIFWYDRNVIGSSVIDFEIVFPSGYDYSEDEIRQIKQLINNHKLASKKYNLRYG